MFVYLDYRFSVFARTFATVIVVNQSLFSLNPKETDSERWFSPFDVTGVPGAVT